MLIKNTKKKIKRRETDNFTRSSGLILFFLNKLAVWCASNIQMYNMHLYEKLSFSFTTTFFNDFGGRLELIQLQKRTFETMTACYHLIEIMFYEGKKGKHVLSDNAF